MLTTTSISPLNASSASAAEDAAKVVTSTRPCSIFLFILYGPLFGSVCALGILGNVLSFILLHKYSPNSVASYLLKSLAVADNMFLIAASSVQIYPAMLMSVGQEHNLLPIYPYIQTYAWPLVHMAQMTSVWMTVLVAGNRYIAVCKPLHALYLCTKGRVKTQMWLMIFLVVVYNTPRFFEYKFIVINGTAEATNNSAEPETINIGLASLPLYNIIYENVSYCLFVFFLPLSVLIFFNAHLVNALKHAGRQRKQITKSFSRDDSCTSSSATLTHPVYSLRGTSSAMTMTTTTTTTTTPQPLSRAASRSATSADENNVTLVMIIIVLVFIICETPAALNQILYYVFPYSDSECTHYNRFYNICNLLVVLNSSLNFVIYCFFRRQFQQQLATLCFCRQSRTQLATTVTPYLSQRQQTIADLELTNCPPISREISTTLRGSVKVRSHQYKPLYPTNGSRDLSSN